MTRDRAPERGSSADAGNRAGARADDRAPGACLEVVSPGLLASVQDSGRPGLGPLGIGAGGAADPVSLAVANLLLGNAPGAAALELTFPGAELRALRRVTVALAGADLGARLGSTGDHVPPGATVELRPGSTLVFAGGAPPAPGRRAGCRAYLAVPGGIDVPVVLGGRATALAAGFGGLEGRALQAGDRLAAADPVIDRSPAHWTGPMPSLEDRPLRVLEGPHAGLLGALASLAAGAWTVEPASDRMGLRLAGGPLPGARAVELASLGVTPGAIQVPADGRPIVLLPDCQPTGGYPVLAVVASADRSLLGQLAPGDRVSFEVVTRDEARAARRALRAPLDATAARLREAASWDALWRNAGG